MKTFKLQKPVKLNGSEINEINLDLESLKGKDLLELETGFLAACIAANMFRHQYRLALPGMGRRPRMRNEPR